MEIEKKEIERKEMEKKGFHAKINKKNFSLIGYLVLVASFFVYVCILSLNLKYVRFNFLIWHIINKWMNELYMLAISNLSKQLHNVINIHLLYSLQLWFQMLNQKNHIN